MNRNVSVYLLTVSVLICSHALAQQPTKVPRIGFQTDTGLPAIAARIEGFRQGLRELGYVEGKNIFIEWRSGDGLATRRNEIAAELVRLNVDLVVSSGPTVTRALREATTTMPIVMAQDSDPIGSGFIASLARPGGNITGLATYAPEVTGKQLELLKEIVPKLSRVAFIGNSTNPGDAPTLREAVLAAGAFELYLRYLDVQKPGDIEPAFRAVAKARAEVILVTGNPVLNRGKQRQQVTDLATKLRLPASYGRPEFIDAGGLMYYGTNYPELFRQAATYVDKILKGAKPSELPVEQPKKFELVINLPAAKKIGLKIPQWTLMKADKVIK